MRLQFRPGIVLSCIALAMLAGCAHRRPTVAMEPTPVAHIVPLPGVLQAGPGVLRISSAVVVEDAGAAPMARRALDELLAMLHIASAGAGTCCGCSGSTTRHWARRATGCWWTMRSI